jgi:hypothetical protein
MRNSAKTARPAARKATSGNGSTRAKKTLAVAAVTRKSEPIIALVERKSATNLREVVKRAGELPNPMCSFVF